MNNTNTITKNTVKSDYSFWASLYLKIDEEIRKYISPDDVIDFDFLLSNERTNQIYINIQHKSKNKLESIKPCFTYKDKQVELLFECPLNA